MGNIKDKVIVITGASSGLGYALAKELARFGAKVVLGARRQDKLMELTQEIIEDGGEAIFRQVDIRRQEEVMNLINLAIEKYQRIDVLVNNAGIMPASFLVKNNTEEWDNLIDINIKGVLYGIGAVLPKMRQQKFGHIINVSSTAAYEEISPFSTIYSMTKHAVSNITEGLRKEEAMAKSNIRVTEIAPGAIDTDLKYTVTDKEMRDIVMPFYEKKEMILSPDEMARAIIYAINEPGNIAINAMVVRPTGH